MKEFKHNRFFENIDYLKFTGEGPYQIPRIHAETFVECEFIGFNYATGCKNPNGKGVHFFIDDYQFERVWRLWPRYDEMLSQFDAVMSPDFSLYTDFPKALQIYNHYRKHYIAASLQLAGVKVYPTIGWSDKESINWCFDGEPVGGTVAVSSVGTQNNEERKRLFLWGYDAMCEVLNPETIIFHGSIPKECRGNIVRIKAFSEKFKEVKVDGR